MTSAQNINPQRARLWLPLDGQWVEGGLRVGRNVGRASGYAAYVRMGDGTTTTTFPTQIVGSRGVRLDGGDYMRVPLDFDRDQAFTIAVLTTSPLSAAGWLAATYDSATARGVRFGSTGSRILTAGIYDDGGRSITVTSAANVIPQGNMLRMYCLSYNGGLAPGSLTMSIDDVVVNGVGAGTALASSISSGRDMLVGARWNAAAPTEIMAASSILWVGEYPTVLWAYEKRLLKARVERELRAGA